MNETKTETRGRPREIAVPARVTFDLEQQTKDDVRAMSQFVGCSMSLVMRAAIERLVEEIRETQPSIFENDSQSIPGSDTVEFDELSVTNCCEGQCAD